MANFYTMTVGDVLESKRRRRLPFDVPIYDTEPQVVKNRFGGGSCTLTPEAVAVYDTIIGAERFGDYETVQKGLAWFTKHYPSEYMVLLD